MLFTAKPLKNEDKIDISVCLEKNKELLYHLEEFNAIVQIFSEVLYEDYFKHSKIKDITPYDVKCMIVQNLIIELMGDECSEEKINIRSDILQ